MKQTAIMLFCVLSFLPIFAADESHNPGVMPLTQEQKIALLAQLKRENPHVSPNDTVWVRIARNIELMCADPLGFYTDSERDKLLLNHITHRELSIDGNSLNELGPQAAREMRECFEKDQEEQIKAYRRAKRIPEHPGLQKVYYMMNIFGFAGFTDYCTPFYCCAAQTALGCYTT